MEPTRDRSAAILITGIAVVALFIVLAAAAYFSGREVGRRSEWIATDAVPGTISAHQMRMAMSKSIGWAMVAAAAQSAQSRDESFQIVRQADEEFAQSVQRYERTSVVSPGKDQMLLGEVTRRYETFRRLRMAYQQLILAGKRGDGDLLLERELVPAYESARKAAEDLLDYNHGNSVAYANEIRGSVRRLYWMVAVVTLLALVSCVVLGMHLRVRVRELKELRESEERFSKAFLFNPCGVAISDAESGRYLEVNESFSRMYGRPPHEVAGRTSLELGMWENAADRRVALEPLLTTGSLRNFEIRTRMPSGGHRVVSINAELIEVRGQRCILSLVEDVTDRKQLQQNQEELATIVECSDDAIIGKTLEGVMTSWNRGAEKITGYTAAEAIGQPALMIIPPENRDEEREIMARIARGETIRNLEIKCVCKDGRKVFVSATISPLKDANGKVVGASRIMRDITEQKLADALRSQVEEELRWRTAFFEAQLHSAIDGVLVVDNEGRKLLQNRRMNELWSIPPEIAGNPDDSLQLQFVMDQVKDARAFEERIAYLNAHPEETSNDIVELIDGTIIERYSAPVRGADGTYYGRLWIFHDLTERQKLEQQLFRAQRIESIGTLAGGIAHDLNNVLGPIMMSFEVLQMKCTDPASQGLMNMIRNSAQHGAEMVQQLLAFGRGTAGRRVVLQIESLVRDVEKIANDTFLKNIEVRTALPETLWMVVGDSTQLHQVLLNLCVNARDAMPAGGRLSLGAENISLDAEFAATNPEARPGLYVLISVADNGVGISREMIERIFDPFFTTKEIGKGTGLGLSTTLSIVKSHGGFIRVESEPGKGSIFRVYLPAQVAGAADMGGVPAVDVPCGNGELILIVDDDAVVCEITHQTLEAFGYRTLVAGNGAEAVTIYRERGAEIAIVVTDLMMPVMDGAATIDALRQMNPAVRIIVSSGISWGGTAAHEIGLGVKHFLPKPFAAIRLLKMLQQVLAEE